MSRSCVSLVCVLASVLAFGGRAHAGATETPFNKNVCANPFPVESMNGPDATGFTNAGTARACIKLCDVAEQQCRAFAKRALDCNLAWATSEFGFERANCLIITTGGQDLKQCNANAAANHQSNVNVFKVQVGAAFNDCIAWTGACEGFCSE